MNCFLSTFQLNDQNITSDVKQFFFLYFIFVSPLLYVFPPFFRSIFPNTKHDLAGMTTRQANKNIIHNYRYVRTSNLLQLYRMVQGRQ